MRLRILALVMATALPLICWSAPAPVEPEPVPRAGEDIENFVVTGRRQEGISVRRFMLDFIGEIGDPVSNRHGYARWRDDICVGVLGLTDTAAAQYVADRISLVALDIGLEPGEPGCTPNLYVVFTRDGRSMASKLVEDSPRSFRPFGGTGGTTQGKRALKQFTTSEAPVRWWQVTMVVDERGEVAVDLGGGGLDPPQIRSPGSLLKNSVSDALWDSIVIVDADKVGTTNFAALTDYLAMVSLAQVDPHGLPSGYDSILNLFMAPDPPGGLTEMDRSYLQALYAMDTMMMPRTQRGILAQTMARGHDE